MCFNSSAKARSAWTLVEMMVGVAVFSVVGLALSSFFIFSMRSFAALSNYAVLDKANRQAMDLLTQEIRQAIKVNSYTTNPPHPQPPERGGLECGLYVQSLQRPNDPRRERRQS